MERRKEIESSLDPHPQIIIADNVHQCMLKLGIKIGRQDFYNFKISPHDISNYKEKNKSFTVGKQRHSFI